MKNLSSDNQADVIKAFNLTSRYLDDFLNINNPYFEGMVNQRTSFHKGVFVGPEYFNNILGTNSHIKGTCIAANFESNGPLVWCLLSIKSGWGNSIPVLPEVMN